MESFWKRTRECGEGRECSLADEWKCIEREANRVVDGEKMETLHESIEK